MATVLSCFEKTNNTFFTPNIAHGKSSRCRRRMEAFITKKADAKLVEKQSAKEQPCESESETGLLHVKTLQHMLQLVQIFIMCMIVGLLMLNPHFPLTH